jgi:tRNA modification GTPase
MPKSPLPLCVVRLTPPGRGAVATLRIEGREAVEAVATLFHARSGRSLISYPADQIVVGRFGGDTGEEIVARRCSDGAVELHCHGGRAAVTRIEESLVSAGCQRMAWEAWMQAQSDDPISVAALAALANARTERTAAILLDQYHGALRSAMEAIQQDIDRGDTRAARQRIEMLLARENLGRHLTQPWRVVLAGRPNVGKSSLLNSLAGYGRAIVHHAPGTTRDAVALTTAIDGWPVELCDTAGLRTTEDAVERAGVEVARERLDRADLAILVTDGSTPWSAAEQGLFERWPAALLVHNKCDLPPSLDKRPAGLSTSTISGQGIDVLLATIGQRLVPELPPPGAPVPFLIAQAETLRQWLTCV